MDSSTKDTMIAHVSEGVIKIEPLNVVRKRLRPKISAHIFNTHDFRNNLEYEYIQKCKQFIRVHINERLPQLDCSTANEFLAKLEFSGDKIDSKFSIFADCPHVTLLNERLIEKNPSERQNILRDLSAKLRADYNNSLSKSSSQNKCLEQPPLYLDLQNYLLHYKTQFLEKPVTLDNLKLKFDFSPAWQNIQAKHPKISENLSLENADLKEEIINELNKQPINLYQETEKSNLENLCKVLQLELTIQKCEINSEHVLDVHFPVLVLSQAIGKIEAELKAPIKK